MTYVTPLPLLEPWLVSDWKGVKVNGHSDRGYYRYICRYLVQHSQRLEIVRIRLYLARTLSPCLC